MTGFHHRVLRSLSGPLRPKFRQCIDIVWTGRESCLRIDYPAQDRGGQPLPVPAMETCR